MSLKCTILAVICFALVCFRTRQVWKQLCTTGKQAREQSVFDGTADSVKPGDG